jgi:hypothetical protein
MLTFMFTQWVNITSNIDKYVNRVNKNRILQKAIRN